MIKRNSKGQFINGNIIPVGMRKYFVGEKSPNWKGGLPNCIICGKKLSRREYRHCKKHSITQETIEKIKIGAKKRVGKNHWNWKGDAACYRGKHNWIVRKKGRPNQCERCGKNGLSGHDIHWANKSGKYKRITSDWIRLCSKCHGEFDKERRKQSLNI